MPGFVKTPADEHRWAAAKEAAKKQTAEGSEGFWKLSNYIFHKMGKSDFNPQEFGEILKSAMGGLKQTQVAPVPGVISPTNNNTASPMKVGSQAVVKTAKPKKLGGAMDKPSVFFGKNEDFKNIKKPSIENLRVFLENQRKK